MEYRGCRTTYEVFPVCSIALETICAWATAHAKKNPPLLGRICQVLSNARHMLTVRYLSLGGRHRHKRARAITRAWPPDARKHFSRDGSILSSIAIVALWDFLFLQLSSLGGPGMPSDSLSIYDVVKSSCPLKARLLAGGCSWAPGLAIQPWAGMRKHPKFWELCNGKCFPTLDICILARI